MPSLPLAWKKAGGGREPRIASIATGLLCKRAMKVQGKLPFPPTLLIIIAARQMSQLCCGHLLYNAEAGWRCCSAAGEKKYIWNRFEKNGTRAEKRQDSDDETKALSSGILQKTETGLTICIGGPSVETPMRMPVRCFEHLAGKARSRTKEKQVQILLILLEEGWSHA